MRFISTNFSVWFAAAKFDLQVLLLLVFCTRALQIGLRVVDEILLWTGDEFLAFVQASAQPKLHKTLHSINTGLVLFTVLQTLGKSLNFWNSCYCIGNAEGCDCTFWIFFFGPIVPLVYCFASSSSLEVCPWKSLSLSFTLCFRDCHFPSVFRSITTLQ